MQSMLEESDQMRSIINECMVRDELLIYIEIEVQIGWEADMLTIIVLLAVHFDIPLKVLCDDCRELWTQLLVRDIKQAASHIR